MRIPPCTDEPLPQTRKIRDLNRGPLPSHQAHQILIMRVAQVMSNRPRRITEEVTRSDGKLLISDLGNTMPGEDINPLLFAVMAVIDERLLAR